MNYYQQPFVCGPGITPGFQYSPQPFFQPFPQGPQGLDPMGMPPVMPTEMPRAEQSYIENILRLNLGKVATVYMNFEGSQWGSKIFKGIVNAAGTDHIILKDVNSETRYILLTIFLNYITFDEDIEYDYPFRKKKKN